MKKLLTLLTIFLTSITFGQVQDTTKVTSLDEVTIQGIRSTKNTPVTQKTLFRSDIQKTYQGFEVATLLNKTTNIIIFLFTNFGNFI